MAYTPELSKKGSGILRRFAWATGKPMTKASEELLEYLPHIVNKQVICEQCKDKSFCNQCAFFGERKEVSTLMMSVCEENK
ncbi:MAG: hypothetical protein OEV78_12690 [Spirochaetia bacterium]|nr:hypothetical protein [Spirochaetia bacterium]